MSEPSSERPGKGGGGGEGQGGGGFVQDVAYDISDWMFEYAHRVKFVKLSPEFYAEQYEYEKEMVAKGIPISVKYHPELWEDFVPWNERPTSPSSEESSSASS